MKLKELISQGESTRLEFKSTLQWDVKQNTKNDALRKMVLKTIAAFLNTEGGTLLIGVEDDGSVYGLEADLALVNKSRDKFAQLIGTLLIEQLGAAYAAPPLVNARFDEVDGKTVYVVEIQPSPEPVFLKGEKAGSSLFGSKPRLVIWMQKIRWNIASLIGAYPIRAKRLPQLRTEKQISWQAHFTLSQFPMTTSFKAS
jgi:predicted HTH transcriptional regulator